MVDRLYFRQLLSGRDFAVGDPIAQQMVNFCYVIGDRETGEAVIVDPAYAADDLLGILEADGMRLVGMLATHHHPDHVGGSMMGFSLAGIQDVLAKVQAPVHVHKNEAEFVRRVTGVSETDLVSHDHDDTVDVGAIPIRLLHTPGHTPGSQCFLVADRLVAGDTLFLDGCGRTDFPGGSPAEMYESLQRLAALPDNPVVYPGHFYSPPLSNAPMADVTATNIVYRLRDRAQWLRAFGG
ncbi:MBL fold metallo-hydrolase [Pseudofrankia asymbiotica]|uniref:MBL fold metallo-hydrolase n=1 Tax=Pseudofrankia asymbiotica TaxID=1834516 RepID=A0A1V2IFV9_9ACTN|nr:MBL fold metallo-hydrolase [Pseudofrankia asymbiotica]ONH31935.1 MBL fold metallo-hydrolase [Pseudofrankia asymbiotica]